jgi:hypothetical protein
LDLRTRARLDASYLVQDDVLDVAREHEERPCIVDTYSLWLDTGEEGLLTESGWLSRAEPQRGFRPHVASGRSRTGSKTQLNPLP